MQRLGLDAGINSDDGITFEYGLENGWSIQYAAVDATAGITGILDSSELVDLSNSLFNGNSQIGDKVSFTEDYEFSVIMLKYNTTADLSERLFYNFGFGFGFTKVDFDLTFSVSNIGFTVLESDKALTFSTSLGLGYRLNKNISLIANYEFRATQDFEFDKLEIYDADFNHNSLDLGVKVSF